MGRKLPLSLLTAFAVLQGLDCASFMAARIRSGMALSHFQKPNGWI
jgi:hypothetical protein